MRRIVGERSYVIKNIKKRLREKFDMLLNTKNRREELNGTDRAMLENIGRIERNLASMIPDSGSEEFWTDRHGLDEFCFAWYSI